MLINSKPLQRKAHRSALRKFVEAEWETIARFAWENYQAEGRGAVGMVNKKEGAQLVWNRVKSLRLVQDHQFGRDALAAALDYDPKTAVVVMWRPDPQTLKEGLRKGEEQLGHRNTSAAPVQCIIETFSLTPAPESYSNAFVKLLGLLAEVTKPRW